MGSSRDSPGRLRATVDASVSFIIPRLKPYSFLPGSNSSSVGSTDSDSGAGMEGAVGPEGAAEDEDDLFFREHVLSPFHLGINRTQSWSPQGHLEVLPRVRKGPIIVMYFSVDYCIFLKGRFCKIII